MEPLTTNPEQTLAGILAQMQSSGPMAPVKPSQQNPLRQGAAIASGAFAGFLGRPDPVEQRANQEFKDHQQWLVQSAQIAGVVSEVVNRKAQRAMQEKQLLLEEAKEGRLREQEERKILATTGMKGLESAGDEATQSMYANMLVKAGLIEEGQIPTLIKGGLAKSAPERLALTIGAIDNGMNPADLGINTAGLNIEALTKLTKPQRRDLLPADIQKKLADASDSRMKALVDGVKAKAAVRYDNGVATDEDKRLLGIEKGSTDQVVASVLLKLHRGEVVTPEELETAKTFRQNAMLKGLTGEPLIAQLAAMGDPAAMAAYKMLSEGKKLYLDNQILSEANDVRVRMQSSGYQLTEKDKSNLLTAEQIAQRRGGKVPPTKVTESVKGLNTILDQLDIIEKLTSKEVGGGQFLGPVAGRIGPLAESIGWTDQTRAALYTAINTLFAELGPTKFGGQFTAGEQKIVKEFQGETITPSENFEIKRKALLEMMDKKLRAYRSDFKAFNWAVPEGAFSRLDPGDAGKKTSREAQMEEGFLKGKSDAEIKKDLGY